MRNKGVLFRLSYPQNDVAGHISPTSIQHIPAHVYSLFFEALNVLSIGKIKFHLEEEKLLSDLLPLATQITRTIKKIKPSLVIIELLSDICDFHAYDDVCELVTLVLRQGGGILNLRCIGIAVANEDTFRGSVILKKRLIPECEGRKLPLLLFTNQGSKRPSVISRGTLPDNMVLPSLQQPTSAPVLAPIQQVSIDEITQRIRLLFDHFQVTSFKQIFHVPALISVHDLCHFEPFIEHLMTRVRNILGSGNFSVCPYGIDGDGMAELAVSMVNADSKRLTEHDALNKHDGSPIILLCSTLSNIYPLREAVQLLEGTSRRNILIVGIVRFLDFEPLKDVQDFSYMDISCSAVAESSPCDFCDQDVPIIKGTDFHQFERKIKEFDHYTFWRLIALRESFYSAGHWGSDVTDNHFEFKIICKSIFQIFGHDIAHRICNLLHAKSIIHGWIKKIICTEGEESATLADHIAQVLRLNVQDVITVPRKLLTGTVGKELNPQIREFISTTGKQLEGKNVLIVDQAAHHFRTVSALRNLSEHCNCAVLAFAVFVNRTDMSFSLGEYVHDCHYISPFSWPCAPRLSHECPCMVSPNTA